MASSHLPKLTQVLELCLYARSLPKAIDFYAHTLQIGPPILATERLAVFPLGQTTLILFQRGATTDDSPMPPAGLIPGHGLPPTAEMDKVDLRTHFCLAVEKREDVDVWEQELRDKGVKIVGHVEWPKGGKSVYFEDVDRHVGEIASRGIWPHW
ncbi:hypothetical protein JCM5296_006043 [Sporobolomyces johnsonii]